jgi:Cu+-exporting ATPase
MGVHWVPSNVDSPGNEELYGGDAGLDGVCADGVTGRREVVAMVSAVEARSEHPLAKAIAVYGKDLLGGDGPVTVIESFESVTGAGVKAFVKCAGRKYGLLIGNAQFITESEVPSSMLSYEEREMKMGRTIVYVSLVSTSSIPILAVSLSDAPKPSSRHAVRALEAMGIEVNMMTGDRKATAIAIAKQVGIRPEGVWANRSPKGKASMITELMEEHGTGVAMVGVSFLWGSEGWFESMLMF